MTQKCERKWSSLWTCWHQTKIFPTCPNSWRASSPQRKPLRAAALRKSVSQGRLRGDRGQLSPAPSDPSLSSHNHSSGCRFCLFHSAPLPKTRHQYLVTLFYILKKLEFIDPIYNFESLVRNWNKIWSWKCWWIYSVRKNIASRYVSHDIVLLRVFMLQLPIEQVIS